MVTIQKFIPSDHYSVGENSVVDGNSVGPVVVGPVVVGPVVVGPVVVGPVLVWLNIGRVLYHYRSEHPHPLLSVLKS